VSEQQHDAFAETLKLIALVENAAAFKARIQELQRETAQAREAQSKLSSETVAVTRRSGELDTRSEHLDKREADIRRREVVVHVRENELEETAKLRGVPFDPKAAQPHGPGGSLTREVDPDEGKLPADAHFRNVPEPVFAEAPPPPPIARPHRSMRRVQE
jgi:hypothetical protein